MSVRHIIETRDFSTAWLETQYQTAQRIKHLLTTRAGKQALGRMLADWSCIIFFYEESTRTRISFELAFKLLGMYCSSTTNARAMSSVAKGERLEDTMRILCGYQPHLIVLRHTDEGAARQAADISDRYGYGVPIINAGDGEGQHPTQALTDVFTIREQFGILQNLHVVVVGDLRYGRTTHSLVYLLAKYPGMRFTFVSPPELSMKAGILEHLDRHKVPWEETDDLSLPLLCADVVYLTRVQKERLNRRTPGAWGTCRHYASFVNRYLQMRRLERAGKKCALTYPSAMTMREGAIIMHPLPRLTEIADEVDALPQARYFMQAENGIPVRMALALDVLYMGHLLQGNSM
jgi:aspartate carbamoyltransferase catalytic subunit